MRHTLFLATLGISPLLHAQSTLVTPVGAEFYEGNSSSGISFGFNNANTQSRIQNIDINLVGKGLRVFRSLAWRRDNRAAPTAVARTADVTILMGTGDFNAMTNTFASNYKTNPVAAFTTKTVNVPDWTAAPATVPAEFDFVLLLDVPFVYQAVDGLLWEIAVQNLSNPNNHYMDFLRAVPHAYGDYPTELAAGCSTANGTMTLASGVRVNGSALELVYKASGAPTSQPVVVLLGASDPNLTIPGLCTTLRSDMALQLVLGTADATGNVPVTVPVSVPWDVRFAGVPLFNQAAAIDSGRPGLPIAVSNAQRCPAPTSTTVSPVNIKRTYSTSNATAVTGSTPEISAVVTRFGF